MKKASETNEVEILDEAHLHHGGQCEWGIFGSQRMTPGEVLAAAEDGEADENDGSRGRVLMVLLDMVLEQWGAEMNAERVGIRVYQVAAAMAHRAGRGLPMLGAKMRIEKAGSREQARRVLDWFLQGEPENLPLGKRILAIGKFVGHSAFDTWSMSELGRACGETPQAMQERMEVVCEAALRSGGSRGKAAWQQPEWQREKSSEAQKRAYAKKKRTKKQRSR